MSAAIDWTELNKQVKGFLFCFIVCLFEFFEINLIDFLDTIELYLAKSFQSRATKLHFCLSKIDTI